MRLIELSGKTFGRLVVLCRASRNSADGLPMWACRCVCGMTTIVLGADLRSGHTVSCGCYKAIWTREHSTVHGDSPRHKPAKEWLAWRNARNRCGNPKDKSYRNYGARGIRVCDRWRASYEAFLADMGRCPPGLTLDRIDVNGNYEPGNCRWVDWSTQRRNRRDSNATAAV